MSRDCSDFVRRASRRASAIGERLPLIGGIFIPRYRKARSVSAEERAREVFFVLVAMMRNIGGSVPQAQDLIRVQSRRNNVFWGHGSILRPDTPAFPWTRVVPSGLWPVSFGRRPPPIRATDFRIGSILGAHATDRKTQGSIPIAGDGPTASFGASKIRSESPGAQNPAHTSTRWLAETR